MTVLGKQEPVRIYYAYDQSGHEARQEEITSCSGAFQFYLERDCAQPRERFMALVEHFQFPRLPTVLTDRCARFQNAPPADDWNGVQKPGTK